MDNKILIAIVAVALIAVAAIAVFTFSGDSEDVPSDTVRYKGNGGSLESGAKYYDYKSTEVVDCLFTKDGYHFVTWNTKSDGSGQEYRVGSKVSLKTVLYAQWSDKNTIGGINKYSNVFQLYIGEKGQEKMINIDSSSTDISPKNAILVLVSNDGSQIEVDGDKAIIVQGRDTYTVYLSISVQGLSLGSPTVLSTDHPSIYYDINQSVNNQRAIIEMSVMKSTT